MRELDPYKPPAAPLEAPVVVRPEPAAYRPIDQLGKVLVAMTLVYGAIQLADVVSYGMQIELLSRIGAHGAYTQEEASQNDLRVELLSALGLLVFVVSAIVYGMFVHRANRNARALGATGMEFTPGWAVGFFFVPVANLIAPYKAVSEIWKASGADSTSWKSARVPWYFPAWWIVWVAGNVTARISQGAAGSKAPAELVSQSILAVAASAMLALGSLLSARIVTDIRKRQELRAAHGIGPSVAGPTAQPIGA
jgi:hypothetical protein